MFGYIIRMSSGHLPAKVCQAHPAGETLWKTQNTLERSHLGWSLPGIPQVELQEMAREKDVGMDGWIFGLNEQNCFKML